MSSQCQTPLLTAKAFFLSIGICIGLALLLCAPYLLFLCFLKLRHPDGLYHWKFVKLIYDMKDVIQLGETTDGLYTHRSDGYGARQHILFCFRHIDKIPRHGKCPDVKDALGKLAYRQLVLADVTWGLDAAEKGDLVAEGESAALSVDSGVLESVKTT